MTFIFCQQYDKISAIMLKVIISRYWKCIIAVTTVCLSLWQLRSLWSIHQLDFHIYYEASRVWRTGGDPYGDLGLGTSLTFLYPTPTLLIFWPLSFLDLTTAQRVWLILNLGLILVSVYLCLTLNCRKTTFASALLTYAFVLQTFSVKYNLGMGQINILVLFLVLLACHLLSRQHERWAGVYLGLAGIVKIWPLALLPFLLYKKQYQIALIAMMTFLIIQLPWWRTTLTSFAAIGSHLQGAGIITNDVYDQSLIVAANRLIAWPGWKTVVPILMLAFYRFISYRTGQCLSISEVCLFLVVPIIFAVSPIYAHYLIYLYPCLYLLFRHYWWLLLVVWLSLQITIGTTTPWFLSSYYAWWLVLLCVPAVIKTSFNAHHGKDNKVKAK